MRIVYIANSPVPSQAANSVHVMKMAQAIADNGHDTELWTPAYNRKQKIVCDNVFEYYGVRAIFKQKLISFLPIKKCRTVSHYLCLAINLLCHRPDLVYTRDVTAAYVAAKLGFPFVFERHDIFHTDQRRHIREFRSLITSRNLKKIVVISEALRTKLIHDYHIPPAAIIVAHDGADPLLKGAEKVDILNRGWKIGYTGHLYHGKGMNLIAHIAHLLPDVSFHVVGGRTEDVDYWQNECASLGNIIFYGHVPPSSVSQYIQAFDILLAPYQEVVRVHGGKGDVSKWMSPLKIFEYMAARKPMIVSDLPVLREVLTHGENALLCQPSNVGEWAEAIQDLIHNPSLAKNIAEKAFQDFEAHYSWKARARYILSGHKL